MSKYATDEDRKTAQRDRERVRKRLWRKKTHKSKGQNRVVESVHAPPQVLADRERRLSEPQSLTAILLGDPPHSRSALDTRGGRP